MGLHGIRVNGEDHKFDYRYLDHKPEFTIPSIDGHEGESLMVGNSGVKWGNASAGSYLNSLDISDTGELGTIDSDGMRTDITFLVRDKDGEVKWTDIIPSYDGEDSEKFLTVTSSGSSWFLGWCGIIPPYGSASEGSSLCVDDYGELKWESILPYHSDWDSGKVLAIDEAGDIEWTKVVPSYDTNDYGKVLSATNNGPDWKSVDTIPQHDERDEGSSLVVDEDGSIGWYRILPTASCLNGGGKRVLTISAAGMEWESMQNVSELPEMPTSTSDGTMLLAATSDYPGAVEWKSVSDVTGIPSHEYADVGSVPTINDGGDIEWQTPPGLPDYSGDDEYKCLIVSDNGDGVEWSRIIPEYTISDAGKTLTVANNGQLKWK